jgi:RNA polymerase subunit RPABC4/transcription elongation factor Spt4
MTSARWRLTRYDIHGGTRQGMDEILNGIGETIGDIFGSAPVQLGLRAIGIYLVILWIATAYWAFRDMQQRSDNAILPYLVAAGIILFTPVFFIFAVWVYKIVRPHEKIGEVWERNLAEEALLAEVEAIHHCPTCERRVNEEWIICPSCRTRLNRVCPNCSRLVGLDWSLCAWCGKDFERRDAVAAATIEPLPSGLEQTGRLTAPSAALSSGIQTTVRSGRGSSRGSSRTAAAQDPLPER